MATVTLLTMVMESGCAGDVVCVLSWTVTVNEKVPMLAVGVPLMTPVEAFSERPLGNAPEFTVQLLYGGVPPAAVRVCE